jgi:hypothetical protein
MREGIDQPEKRLNCHWKGVEIKVETTTFAFCMATLRLVFSEIYKRGL